MSNKCQLGRISQSFIVLGVAAVLSAAGSLHAQNPYDSAMANSQAAMNGSTPSAQALPQGSGEFAQGNSQAGMQANQNSIVSQTESVPSVYGNSGNGQTMMAPGTMQGNAVQGQMVSSSPAVGQYAGNAMVQSDMNGQVVTGTPAPESVYAGQGQVVYSDQVYAARQPVFQMESAQPPTYGAGFSTMPDYPRNNVYAPVGESTPDPAPEYPQTRDEMVPERVGRTPPLTPYDQQETYSYITETSTSNSTACQRCNEGYGNPYLWQIGASGKIKHRARHEKGDAAFFNANGTMGYDANMSYPIAAGAEIFATRYLGRNAFNFDIWANLRFDGLYEWDNSKTYYGQENMYSSYGIAGLTTMSYPHTTTAAGTTEGSAEGTGTATPTTTTYTSFLHTLHVDSQATMNTGELVFQFRKRGRPDPLIGHPNGTWTRECQGGARYTHLFGVNFTTYNEELNWKGSSSVYNSTSTYDSTTYIGEEYGYANVETNNNMVGLVLGGEFVDKHCVWSWGMRWRFTPYLNFMENSVELRNDQNYYDRMKISETDIAYEAKWGIFTTYKFGKHVIWRLGYDVSCLGNLALAGQNLYVNETIKNNNYNIFQEVTLGCTVVW